MDSVLEDMYAHASRELAAKGEFDAEIATYDISRETRQPVTAVQRTIGMHALSVSDTVAGLFFLGLAAGARDPDACYLLAQRFVDCGPAGCAGLVPDTAAAAWLIRTACAAGHSDACKLVNVSTCPTTAAAVRRAEMAIEAGNVAARAWLALCYMRGTRVEKDFGVAKQLLAPAIKANNSTAILVMAMLLGLRRYENSDRPRALELLHSLVTAGNVSAAAIHKQIRSQDQ